MNKKLFVGQLLVVCCLLFVVICLLLVKNAEAKVLLPDISPDCIGTYSQWSGSCTDIDEYPNNDGNTTFNSIALNNTKQAYNFQNNSDSGSIRGVRVVFYAKVHNGTNVEYIRPFLRINNGDYFGDNCTTINNSSYTQCSYYWSVNPYNSSTWSTSDLTSLQAGFETQANGGWDSDEHRVSQLYIDVDFKSETKKTKYFIVQQLVAVASPQNDAFTFSIADQVDEVRSAFIEIKGLTETITPMTLGVKVDDSAGTPGSYDKTYTIDATGRPTMVKIEHDVTDYFKSFVFNSGSYTRYLHLNPSNNIYLLNAKLVITYTHIIPPVVAGSYRAKAELTSAVFDTGVAEGVAYNSVMWKGNLNSGKVRLKIATAAADTGPWSYLGPASGCSGNDGGDSDWFVIDANAPTEIKCFSSHNNKQFFRYKIQLCSASNCTDSGEGHPEVTDVIISWSP